MSSELVLKEARALPFAEKLELCRALWNDLAQSTELTPGEADLIDHRLMEHQTDPADTVPLAEVKARLDAKYGK